MAGKNTSVFGICKDIIQLETIVDTLRLAGFRSDDIAALFPDKNSTRTFAHEHNTKPPEGAATGARSGMVLGGTLG